MDIDWSCRSSLPGEIRPACCRIYPSLLTLLFLSPCVDLTSWRVASPVTRATARHTHAGRSCLTFTSTNVLFGDRSVVNALPLIAVVNVSMDSDAVHDAVDVMIDDTLAMP